MCRRIGEYISLELFYDEGLAVVPSQCRHVSSRKTKERGSYIYIYAYSRDRKQTQLPVIQAQCRYSNARETRERRSYLSYGHNVCIYIYMRTRETGNRLSYLSYRHSVGIAMHERQEKEKVRGGKNAFWGIL